MQNDTPRKSRPCLLEALESRCLMSAGDLDPTFGVGGKVLAQNVGFPVADIAVQPNGKIIAVGRLNNDFAVARLNPDGKLDRTFGSGDGVAQADFGGDRGDFANTVAIQPNGKIVVGGRLDDSSFTSLADIGGFAVARFNTDGTLDNSFDGNGRLTIDFPGRGASSVSAIAIQPDGKIVLAGIADTVGRIDPSFQKNDFAVARINPNGSLDHTFGNAGPGTIPGVNRTGKLTIGFGSDGGSEGATAIALAPGGKIVVGGLGGFGKSRFAVARLNANGTLDGSFGDGISGAGKFNNLLLPEPNLRDLTVQPDGSVVLVGGSQGNFAVARLTSAGRLDKNFAGTGHVETDLGGTDEARHVRVSKEGILVAGGSSGKFAMARFKTNGLLDGFFGKGGKVITAAGANDAILTTSLTSDGKILAFGRSGSMARYISAVPKVGVFSLDNSAREGASDHQANFIVTRDAVYSFNTRVFFDLSGNATFDADYGTSLTLVESSKTTSTLSSAVSGPTTFGRRAFIDIPAGQSFVVVPINVINDTASEGTETVKLSVAANNNYTVGTGNTATVSVLDNDVLTIQQTSLVR